MAILSSIVTLPATIGLDQVKDAWIPLVIATFTIGLTVLLSQRLKVRGLPGPPHSLLSGSIPVFSTVAKHAPKDLHPQAQMTMIQRLFKLGDLFCVDTWPFMDQVYLVANPYMAHQVSQEKPFPKHPMVTRFMESFTGLNSVLLANDAKWKELRSLFSPGFSNAHLMTMVPVMVDKTEIFCDILAQHAKTGAAVPMEPLAAKLTIDIIGLVVLGVDFGSQTGEDELVNAFRHLLDLIPDGQRLEINPIRRYNRRYYSGVMDNYIRRVLRARSAKGANNKFKTLMDIAIGRYEDLVKNDPKGSLFNCGFEQLAIDNLKTFVFAGHDTSSTTISYVYHLLHKHPKALAKVLEEHDEILGKDLTKVPAMIRANPALINKLAYTTAVIREALRLYPASGSLRMAPENITFHPTRTNPVTIPKGNLIWVGIHTIHHDAEYFPCPDEFHPERFLNAGVVTLPDGRTEATPAGWNGHVPPQDAYRPFEKGPRQCIGSEMAMIEIRVVLAMTMRLFTFETAFEEWRDAHPEETDKRHTSAFGDEAYQVYSSTAKPKSGMPMRVGVRK
ncbi:cytochrome P450 [Aspergillus heteromorphus CBS 117.55]|uniref:Cytochrome P450 n=1 Tax=Aspergillus heteromorphus CBS 117.55 TaxID=1448321 RepID=A0A317W3K1_9EURO|nr:cytochrome P450 [Aspergillus heteromorphus CBS 117.55]PWY79688.1 cytochrome P450 [Aspergillus heteromorphus CBS 117.55]